MMHLRGQNQIFPIMWSCIYLRSHDQVDVDDGWMAIQRKLAFDTGRTQQHPLDILCTLYTSCLMSMHSFQVKDCGVYSVTCVTNLAQFTCELCIAYCTLYIAKLYPCSASTRPPFVKAKSILSKIVTQISGWVCATAPNFRIFAW